MSTSKKRKRGVNTVTGEDTATHAENTQEYIKGLKDQLNDNACIIERMRERLSEQAKDITELRQDIRQLTARDRAICRDNTYLLSLLRSHVQQQRANAQTLHATLVRFACEELATVEQREDCGEAFREPASV